SPAGAGFPISNCECLGSAAALSYCALKLVRRGVLEVLKGGLRLGDQCAECLRLVDREVGKNLTVDLDASLVQAVNEAAVGQAVLTDSSIDALDPQSAEIALAILPVAICVLKRLLNRLLGDADGVLATAVETLGLGKNLLVLSVGGYAPFDACHLMISLNSLPAGSDAAAVGQEVCLDVLGVGFSKNHRAARVADELVGTLDHPMAFTGSSRQHLARSSDFEPLFRGRLGLHLGHFAFLSLRLVSETDLPQADRA